MRDPRRTEEESRRANLHADKIGAESGTPRHTAVANYSCGFYDGVRAMETYIESLNYVWGKPTICGRTPKHG